VINRLRDRQLPPLRFRRSAGFGSLEATMCGVNGSVVSSRRPTHATPAQSWCCNLPQESLRPGGCISSANGGPRNHGGKALADFVDSSARMTMKVRTDIGLIRSQAHDIRR